MKIALGIAIAIVSLLIPVFAANSQAQTQSEQIEALKRQIKEIQRQNQQQIEELRKKVEELEATREADKKKAEELTAAGTKEEEEAWWKKIEAEYKKPGDGFALKTKDGNFKLRTRINTQFQFSINDRDSDDTTDTNFDIRRLRLYFDGNAFRPWLLYTIQVDAESSSLSLRDVYLDFAYNTLFAPRVGQFKVPFSREQLNSAAALQLVERSILDEEFGFGHDAVSLQAEISS